MGAFRAADGTDVDERDSGGARHDRLVDAVRLVAGRAGRQVHEQFAAVRRARFEHAFGSQRKQVTQMRAADIGLGAAQSVEQIAGVMSGSDVDA